MLKLLLTLVLFSTHSLLALAAEPIDVGTRRELFVDDHVVEKIEGDARLELQQPAPREVALVADKPWEGNLSAFYTVFRDRDSSDGDICRMYYRGAHYDTKSSKQTHRQLVCYAESKDGIHWTKPNLGLVEFEGSKENNIVWGGAGGHCFTPFKDTNPNCPPEERYKALSQVHKTGKADHAVRGEMTVFAYTSPDGIHWTISDLPLITKGDFDSQNVAFWDPHAGLYREYHRARILRKPDGELVIGVSRAAEGIRSIMTGTSKNFLNETSWSEPTPLEFTDHIGDQHMYTSAVMSYPRAPQILIGFPTRLLPEQGNRVEPILMVSRDGRTFKRWDKPVIPEDAPEDRKGNRSNYMAWGLVPTSGNDREYSVYASENYLSTTHTRLRRFLYRVDGFVALRGGELGGQLTTRPLNVAGGQLEINYLARPGGHVRVEIQDAGGKPLAGFAAADCDPLDGDEIAKMVTWKTDGDGPFTERPVRVRFEVKDADVYSFRFK
ncbi:MAG: hypothetical protein H8E66_21395 [Planctomycetes bacterium]|nr:hypothetical protein [Planctomycetota bacterium]